MWVGGKKRLRYVLESERGKKKRKPPSNRLCSGGCGRTITTKVMRQCPACASKNWRKGLTS